MPNTTLTNGAGALLADWRGTPQPLAATQGPHTEAESAADVLEERALYARDREIRSCVPRWHFAMLNDAERGAAYELALATEIGPKMHVLDIGSGSGLLGMLAARYGASHVTSCEATPEIADVARRIVGKSGFGDRVNVVSKLSTGLGVSAGADDMPRRVDLLVTEIVDCGLVGEGIIPTIRHARDNFLADGGTIIPCAATIYATLIESEHIGNLNAASDTCGLDVRTFNELSSQAYFPVRSHTWPHMFLSSVIPAFEVDFLNDSLEPTTREVRFTAKQTGTCHAIMFWFDMQLAPGISVRNQPGDQKTHWMQAVQCMNPPVPVRAGEVLSFTVRQTDSALRFVSHE